VGKMVGVERVGIELGVSEGERISRTEGEDVSGAREGPARGVWEGSKEGRAEVTGG
jgi:hypothetical protein